MILYERQAENMPVMRIETLPILGLVVTGRKSANAKRFAVLAVAEQGRPFESTSKGFRNEREAEKALNTLKVNRKVRRQKA